MLIYFNEINNKILIKDLNNRIILKKNEDMILQCNLTDDITGTTQAATDTYIATSGNYSNLLIDDTKFKAGNTIQILSTLNYSNSSNGTWTLKIEILQYHNGSWEHKVTFNKNKSGTSSGNLYTNINLHFFDKSSTEYTIIKQVDDVGKGDNQTASWYKNEDIKIDFIAIGPTGGSVTLKNTAVIIY